MMKKPFSGNAADDVLLQAHTVGFSSLTIFLFGIPQLRNFAIPWSEYHENFAIGMKWLLFVGLLM